MQTSFTLAQLADPAIAEADKILRACVHCGFCTATCPTYVLLGDELDSPARTHLPDQGHAGARPRRDRGSGQAHRPLPLVPLLHDDLSVRRALHAPRRSRPHAYRRDVSAAVADRAIRALLAKVLPYPARFRAALRAGALGQVFAPLFGAIGLRPIAAMLRLAPSAPAATLARKGRRVFPAQGARKARVALLQVARSRYCALRSTSRRSDC